MSIEELKDLHHNGSLKILETNPRLHGMLAEHTPYEDIQRNIFNERYKIESPYRTAYVGRLSRNPKLAHDLQIPILSSTRRNMVHSYIAENPNIHPDTIKHLIDHHHKCDDVRYGIEQNKSLSGKQKHDIIDAMLEKNKDYL